MNPKETGYEIVEWILLAEDRAQWRDRVSAVMNLQVS
jgi:hypothetical protein